MNSYFQGEGARSMPEPFGILHFVNVHVTDENYYSFS